ncbi:MAG: hypothetical protein H6Q42_1090 [Deltaproteobacteria bacterium]|nr:hypothetical protein [Deltaproteobacteria bacterium]
MGLASFRLFPLLFCQETEIRNNGKMVGGDEGSQVAESLHPLQFEPAVIVDMVEVHERQDPGIASDFAQNRPGADALKMRMEKARSEPGDPLIKITENDSRPHFPRHFQDVMINQSVGLVTALRVSGPQVKIVNVQCLPGINLDIRLQAPPLFSPMLGDIIIAGKEDREAAERDISISSPAKFSIFPDLVMIPQLFGDELRLVILTAFSLDAEDLLQGDDVGFDFAKDPGDAFNFHPLIQTLPLVNIVGDDAEAFG